MTWLAWQLERSWDAKTARLGLSLAFLVDIMLVVMVLLWYFPQTSN